MNLDLLPKKGYIKMRLLAEVFDLSESGLQLRINKGAFPKGIKFGRYLVWKVEDVKKALGIIEEVSILDKPIIKEVPEKVSSFIDNQTLLKCIDEIIINYPIFNSKILLDHLIKKNLLDLKSKRTGYIADYSKNLVRRLRDAGYIKMLTINSGTIAATYQKNNEDKILIEEIKRETKKLQSIKNIVNQEILKKYKIGKEFTSYDVYMSLKDTVGKESRNLTAFTSTIRDVLKNLKTKGILKHNKIDYKSQIKIWTRLK